MQDTKKVNNLVVGGTGFLAEALIPRLKGNIRVLARNEGKLVSLREKYPNIEIMTGDIADEWTVKKAMKGMDRIYHLAAMKSVDIAEQQVFSCINTNLIGTLNLLLESLNTRPELFVFISTDKAAQVNGVYGATKMLSERLIIEAQELNPETTYRTVRYGNVIGSSSSFLTKWIPNMKKGVEVCITDPNMTRFFWTKDEAVDLIFKCIDEAKDATPFIPEMKGISMGKVLEACQEVYGYCPVKTIGNRGGENMHETMGNIGKDGKLVFSNTCEQMTKAEFKVRFLTNSV